MATIRPVRWPDDIPQLIQIDTSFTTDRIYRSSAPSTGRPSNTTAESLYDPKGPGAGETAILMSRRID